LQKFGTIESCFFIPNRPNLKSFKKAIVKFHSKEAAQRVLDAKIIDIQTSPVTVESVLERPPKQTCLKVEHRPHPNPP
jgi:hypothetical protein